MERFYAPLCFRILNIKNDSLRNELQTKSLIQRDMLTFAIEVLQKKSLKAKNINPSTKNCRCRFCSNGMERLCSLWDRLSKGKALFGSNGGRDGKVEVGFDNFGGGKEVGNCGGNGGRGSSIFGSSWWKGLLASRRELREMWTEVGKTHLYVRGIDVEWPK
ncbi:hypothetical protein Tco_0982647 [Tanacetum coccineum]